MARKFTEFVSAVIQEDANYFFEQGFINHDQRQRALSWLCGNEDAEAQHMVVGWLDKDAKYMAELEKPAARQLWYMYPAVILGLRVLRNQLIDTSNELKGATAVGEKGLSQLLPMKPDEGPPLPRIFNIRWPGV